MGWYQQMKQQLSKRNYLLVLSGASWYQLMRIWKGKIWDVETQQNSYAKPQRPH